MATSLTEKATGQMNVRMSKTLHQKGNEAFASLGISPSEAVRALWEKAAKRGKDLEELVSLILSKDASSNNHEGQLSLVQEGQQLFRNAMSELGIDMESLPIDIKTYDELRDEMYDDALKEMGY